MIKLFYFQTIQSFVRAQYNISSIDSIFTTLSDATTPGQVGSRSDSIEGVLRIPQSFSITEALPSDFLMLYPRHSLGEVLRLCRESVGIFYSPSQSNLYILCV